MVEGLRFGFLGTSSTSPWLGLAITGGIAVVATALASWMFATGYKLRSCIACDQAKNAAANLAGKEAPRHEDNETTFEDVRARIAKCRAYLDTFTAADFDHTNARYDRRNSPIPRERGCAPWNTCTVVRSRTSISTWSPPTTFCATVASMSARATTWDRLICWTYDRPHGTPTGMKIVAISGSLRSGSSNAAFPHAAATVAPEDMTFFF